MNNQFETLTRTPKNIIQQSVGIYPVTSLGISFFYYCTVDLLICRKNGLTSKLFAEKPLIKINDNETVKEIDISEIYVNGMIDAIDKKVLPAVIICTPQYHYLENLIDEVTETALLLHKKELLRGHTNLKFFYFPTIILASNGIIFDEATYNIKSKLEKAGMPEIIINNIISKIVRASVMQGSYRDGSIYYPHQKGLIKIALPKFPLFSQIVDLLNTKQFTFSVHTNPHRIEFEKAMVNIATNAIAMVFALDKQNCRLTKINIQEALAPIDATHSRFVKEVQTAIFEIGKRAGAFSATDTFEKVWLPRKEQILKHDREHISSSLNCFKNMIKTREFPEGLPSAEYALTYPLKCFARHYELADEFILIEELESMLLNNLEFAKKHANKITVTF